MGDEAISAIFLTLVLCVLYAYAAGAIIISEELKNFIHPKQKWTLLSVPKNLAPSWMLSISFPLSVTGVYLLAGSTNQMRDYGLVGLLIQVLYSYLSIPVVICLFQRLQQQLPRPPESLVQYVYWRHGMMSGLLFNLLSIFNTLCLLVGEYVVIQQVLQVVVEEEWFAVTLLAMVAVFSAAYGGTLCSIINDIMQGAIVLILTAAFCIFVLCMWRPDGTSHQLTEFSLGIQPSQLRYSLFCNFCLYVPLYCISEPLWLRAASAKSPDHLERSMWFAPLVGVLLAGVYAALSVLEVLAGHLPDGVSGSGIFFMFPDDVGKKWASWPNMILLIISLSLNRSYADAHHDGLMRLFQPLVPHSYQRMLMPLLLVGINAPMLGIAIIMNSGSVDVNILYVPAGILVTSVCFPIILGVFDMERRLVRGLSLAVIVLTTALATSIYGIIAKNGNIQAGLLYAWLENYNSWDVMTVAVGTSVLALAVSVAYCRYHCTRDSYSGDLEHGGCTNRDCCSWVGGLLP